MNLPDVDQLCKAIADGAYDDSLTLNKIINAVSERHNSLMLVGKVVDDISKLTPDLRKILLQRIR